MKYYKTLLLEKLSVSGWDLVEQDNETEWWLEESWKIKSIKQNWGLEIFILFLVDPQFEGEDKSKAVWAIMARSHFINSAVLRGMLVLAFLAWANEKN